MREENKKFFKQINELRATAVSSSKGGSSKEYENLKKENAHLLDQIQQFQVKSSKSNETYEQSIANLKKELSRINGELKEAKAARIAGMDSADELKKVLQENESLRATNASLNEKYTSTLDGMKSHLDLIKASKLNDASELEVMEQKIEDLTKELKILTGLYESEKEKCTKVINELRKTNDELNKHIRDSENMVQTINDQIKDLDKKDNEISELKRCLANGDEAVKHMSNLRAENEVLKISATQNANYIQLLSEKDHEIDSLKFKILENEKHINDLDGVSSEMIYLKTSSGNDIDPITYNKSINALKAEIQANILELAAKDEEIARLTGGAIKGPKKDRVKEVDYNESKNHSVKGDIMTRPEEIRKLSDEIEELKAEVEENDTLIIARTREIELLNKKLSDKSIQYETAVRQLEDRDKKLSCLESDNKVLIDEVKDEYNKFKSTVTKQLADQKRKYGIKLINLTFHFRV